MKKIIWLETEQAAVKRALKDLLLGRGWETYGWATLLNLAQQEALPRNRWRKENSLVPGVSINRKTQDAHWGCSRDIVFEVLRELEWIPEQPRRCPLPHPSGLRPPRPFAAAVRQPSLGVPEGIQARAKVVAQSEHLTVLARLKQSEAELSEARSTIKKLETERAESSMLSRLAEIEKAVESLTDFVTSHGYVPHRDFNGRAALGKAFAA